MRFVSYNLYEGAQDTYTQLQDFLGEQQPDVLCLQEANGWNDGNPKRIDDFGENVGLPHHVYGNSNTRFKLATFLEYAPISSHVRTEGFWHSAIRTTVEYNGSLLNIWNIHLDPKEEDKRVAEVERLLILINPHEQTIITGDFNSLSEADNYPDNLIDKLTAQSIAKFGTDRLRFDVTKRLAEAGFVDAATELGVATNTVPTPANQDANHAVEMRLDYMFVSSGLVKHIKSITVPKTSLTDKISDHYPIVLDI